MIRTRRAAAVAFAAALVLGLAATPVVSASPFGATRLITVDGAPFDSDWNDVAHVGCVFQIEFSGFPEGDLFAEVAFASRAPSGKALLLTDGVFLGEDAAGGTGDLDASSTYDIGAVVPSATASHLKLTITADGRTKSKSVWVEDCAG